MADKGNNANRTILHLEDDYCHYGNRGYKQENFEIHKTAKKNVLGLCNFKFTMEGYEYCL